MPNIRMLYNVTEPTLTMYPAVQGKGNGTSMIVAPSGAFHILSIYSKGHDVAKWLSTRGITAFILTYRVFSKPPKGTSCLSFGKPSRFAKAKGKKLLQAHKN